MRPRFPAISEKSPKRSSEVSLSGSVGRKGEKGWRSGPETPEEMSDTERMEERKRSGEGTVSRPLPSHDPGSNQGPHPSSLRPRAQAPNSSSLRPRIQAPSPSSLRPRSLGPNRNSRAPVVACGLWFAANVTVQSGLATADVPVVIIARYGDLRGVWRK